MIKLAWTPTSVGVTCMKLVTTPEMADGAPDTCPHPVAFRAQNGALPLKRRS
jgi:hypothetical protein